MSKVEKYEKMLDRIFNRIRVFSNLTEHVSLGGDCPDHMVAYDAGWYLDEMKKFEKIKKEK
jgi:hypothetical protein